MSVLADWGGLHYDILALILKRLKQIEEFVVFGSVCKSWRIVARDNKRYLAPQIPWLMLLDNPENKYHRQIYSLSKEDILTKNLYIPELYDGRCFGLNYGWVLTVTRLGGEMNLVHPVSRKQIELPPHTSIQGYENIETWPSYIFIGRAALRGNPSQSSDFMVMMAVHASGDYVYYWRPGCKDWILITGFTSVQTLTCYQDQFYAVSGSGKVFVLKNDHEGSIVPHLIGRVKSKALTYWTDTPYIVGSTRGLLVVVREEDRSEEEEEEGEGEGEDVPDEEMEWEDWRYGLVKFHVFELDFINGGHTKIKDLGDRAIFVGQNTSICFEHASDLPGIKSNHVYFTSDYYGSDMGVYGLEDGRITQFKIDKSSQRTKISPPFWFIPSL